MKRSVRVTEADRLAVVIPVYGQHALTHQLLDELNDDGYPCRVWVIDNCGDYNSRWRERVVVAPTNLHWAGGCNLGMREARRHGPEAFVLLNNDVRISRGFLEGLVTARRKSDGALIGPLYDRNWPQQRGDYLGSAAQYEPAPRERNVPFIDGTCMLIPADTLEVIGPIDDRTWPLYGWGCDKDYACRVRRAGGHVVVTERSYLNHLNHQTALTDPSYSEWEAENENDAGMCRKWGPDWRDLLYEGFVTSRMGLTQVRLARERR
jgi:GT2 family glycosyltransferase